MTLRRAQLAAMIDHTLLAPTASDGDVRALVAEAIDLGVGAVCVSPSKVVIAAAALVEAESTVMLASVAGFPSGAHRVPITEIRGAME